MTNKQSHPSLQDDRFTIRIRQNGSDINVKSPLPDEFGFTVGSEFSAPFDGNFLSGTGAKVLAAGGVSSKLGIATKKLYTSPEPTEITFDMQFEAFQSARQDVYYPVIKLMSMAIGSSLSLEEAAQLIEDMVNEAATNTGRGERLDGQITGMVSGSGAGETASKAWDFLSFVQGPPTVTLRFGNVIKFKNTYITSVAPSFSNIMDSEGLPMSCTASVTAILEKDPIVDDENFEGFFSQINQSGVN